MFIRVCCLDFYFLNRTSDLLLESTGGFKLINPFLLESQNSFFSDELLVQSEASTCHVFEKVVAQKFNLLSGNVHNHKLPNAAFAFCVNLCCSPIYCYF